MPTTNDLERAVEAGLAYLKQQDDVEEAEVYASANGSLLARLNYTSHIPCNGVEEPKSSESHGIGVQVVFADADATRIGFGYEPGDITPTGAARAFAKARKAGVVDPEFVCLPRPGQERRALVDYHDPRLMDVSDHALVEAGWTVVHGALRTFVASSRLADLAGSESALPALGLILGGDVTILQERMAIASAAMPEPQVDESTLITAFVTA